LIIGFSISKLGNVAIWVKITKKNKKVKNLSHIVYRKVKNLSHIAFMFFHNQSLFVLSAHACGHVGIAMLSEISGYEEQ